MYSFTEYRALGGLQHFIVQSNANFKVVKDSDTKTKTVMLSSEAFQVGVPIVCGVFCLYTHDLVSICTSVCSQRLLLLDIFGAILFCLLHYLHQYNTFNNKFITYNVETAIIG